MKITIESTTKTVMIAAGEHFHAKYEIACRVWEGETEHGIKVQCLIPRIAALANQDLAQFEAELEEQKAPSSDVQIWPLRMVL